MITTKDNRTSRFSIRVSARQKEIITRAAHRSNRSVSEFLLENSIEAAEGLELDNAHFVVGLKDYEEILRKLDESPRSIPALRHLLLHPTSIDVPNN